MREDMCIVGQKKRGACGENVKTVNTANMSDLEREAAI